MDLFRDVMDKQVVDCDGHKIGKVDDLILQLEPGQDPIVSALVTGHGSLAPLLGGRIASVVTWFRSILLGEADREPDVIPWNHVSRIDVVVHLDLDRWKGGFMDTEQDIWHRWVSHLPFAER